MRVVVTPSGLLIAFALAGPKEDERDVLWRLLLTDPALAMRLGGQGLMADKGYRSDELEKLLAEMGITLIRPAMKGERERPGRQSLKPFRQIRLEGDHCLTATTPAQHQAVEAIVEDAQHDLVRRAHRPVVLAGDGTAALTADMPETITELLLDQAVMTELLGGERDVFAAACADELSGLHGPPGRPCPAQPWVCLACPLAVFAPPPRHEPAAAEGVFGLHRRGRPAGRDDR